MARAVLFAVIEFLLVPIGDQSINGRWFKSDFSAPACACVETRHEEDTVLLRDSKWIGSDAHERPIIRLSASGWTSWLIDLASSERLVGCAEVDAIANPSDGSVTLRAVADGTELWFTAEEWEAFILGVEAGQFDRRAERLTPMPLG